MTELEKRVAQLEQEIVALKKEIQGMPHTIGKAVLEAARRKEALSSVGSSGTGNTGCSNAEFKITQRGKERRLISKVDRDRVGDEVLEMARSGFSSLKISEALRGKGIEISRSSISRYIHRYLFGNAGKE